MIDHSPSEDDQAQVLSWLREFNLSENGAFLTSLAEGVEQPFFVVSKDDEGRPNGGLQGSVLHHWLKIDLMAVCPSMRRQGVGRQLVKEAESFALQCGCKYAYVDTMSYQAPKFYRALGYDESGRLKDWDSHGHDKVFLSKRLMSEG